MFGNVIDACKVITDSVLKAKEYSYQILKKAGEKIGTKRKEISNKCVREGRRMNDVIKRHGLLDIIYMIDPNIEQKKKKD
jgi:hypothetical protein